MAETTLLADSHHQRADAKLIEMAIKRGWKIPDSVLESLPAILATMVARADDERAKVAAARVLVAMHGQNVKANEAPRNGHTINVGVRIDADARRSQTLAIAERIRTGRILGESAE